jgi:hypothetical protein
VFLFALFFASALAYGVVATQKQGDLKILLGGARVFREGGTPYILPMGRGGFEYAPFMLIPFLALDALPRILAGWGWHIILSLCLLISAILTRRCLTLIVSDKRIVRWSLLAALFLVSSAVVRELKQGQTDMPLLLLLSGSIYYSVCGRGRLSGFFAGAATAMKLYPATTLLYFAARREWRESLTWMLAPVAALLLPMLVFGPTSATKLTAVWLHDYMAPSLGGPPPEWTSPVRNQSLPAFLYRAWGEPSRMAQLSSLVASLALIFASGYVLWRTFRDKDTESRQVLGFALLICLFLLICPLTQKHLYIFLLLPWGAAVSRLLEGKRSAVARLAFAAALVLQLVLWFAGGKASWTLRSYSAHAFIALLLWTGLLAELLGAEENLSPEKLCCSASLRGP